MSGDDQARKRPVRDDSPGPSKKWRHSRDDDSPADEDTLDLGHRINENAAEAGPAGSQLPAVVVTTHDSATEHNEHDDEVIAQDPHDVNRPSTSGMSRSSEGGTNPGGDTRTPAETTKKPYRLKIKLPDCEPGPSGLQFPRPKSRTGDAQRSESEASTSGFLPPFIFDRNRPFKDRSELAKTAPYSLGRGYSNYFELNALEDMVKESKVFLTDAATVRSIADAEENLLTRVMGYLRAIAVYIVAADTLESVENHPRRALETYQQARALVTDANQLLSAIPESRTRTRLSIFYLRVESWLESRMCRLRKILAAEEMFMAQQATFCRVVRRLRTLALADVPPTKTVPTEITLQQRNNVLESMALQGAFDSWFLSVRRISDSRDDAFFLAVECALLKYISMLCEPRLFVEYIREFVSRIERFKDQEG